MFLFIDESGNDRREAPYEILAGMAVSERDLWNLVQAVQSLELEIFGVRLGDVGVELKGKKLLKRKTFRHAGRMEPLGRETRRVLCAEFLQKGRREFLGGPVEPRRSEEFAAYGQAALDFVRRVYSLCGDYRVKVFASIVNPAAYHPRTLLCPFGFDYSHSTD